jgi:hypothetical protein
MSEMTMPEVPSAPPPAKKSNKTVIIIVAIVVVLCCCCLVLIGGGYYLYTQGNDTITSIVESFSGTTDIVGDWTISWSWDCTSDYSSGYITFYDDGTFNVNDDSSLWGTWQVSGKNADFSFDEYPNSHYVGTVSGNHMEGTMDNLDNMSGCWYADK